MPTEQHAAAKLNELKRLWVGLSVYYRTPLDPEQLRLYAEDLEDLDLLDVGRAIQALRRDPARRFLPLPAEVREKVLGNEAQDALEASGRIVEAMAKYGWTNSERARAYIGELGWLVVEREGGWQALCERTQSDELPTLKAQWREMAKALRARAQRGALDKPPGLLPGSTEAIEKHLGLDKAKGPLPVTFADPARTLPGRLGDYATFGDDGRLMADKHTMPINNYPRGEK